MLVNVKKINAWIKPTKISKIKKGKGARNGIKLLTTISKTSPANILPYNLKLKERIFENSEKSSKIPIGERYFFIKSNFNLERAIKLIPITEIKPKAKVIFKSEQAVLKR